MVSPKLIPNILVITRHGTNIATEAVKTFSLQTAANTLISMPRTGSESLILIAVRACSPILI